MLRLFTSLIWLIGTLAFGFDAVAQPCDMLERARMVHVEQPHADMPCHQDMEMAGEAQEKNTPHHTSDTCCCAALLTTAIILDPVDLSTDMSTRLAWDVPVPEQANSSPFEYEPPPPRA